MGSKKFCFRLKLKLNGALSLPLPACCLLPAACCSLPFLQERHQLRPVETRLSQMSQLLDHGGQVFEFISRHPPQMPIGNCNLILTTKNAQNRDVERFERRFEEFQVTIAAHPVQHNARNFEAWIKRSITMNDRSDRVRHSAAAHDQQNGQIQ